MGSGVNAEIFGKLVEVHGLQEEMRHSADKIVMDEHGDLDKSVTTDFLHAQNEPDCPPHTLRIVKGALYELTRNFSAAERLMNRTKVIVRDTKTHHLVVETLDGRVFPLPRILFHWQIGRGVVTMSRRQFPLRPAYASTFNGAQGETLQTATVDIRQSPFSHGQLYVALGRVRHRTGLFILTTEERCATDGCPLAKNIVWPEFLLPDDRVSGDEKDMCGSDKRKRTSGGTSPATKAARWEECRKCGWRHGPAEKCKKRSQHVDAHSKGNGEHYLGAHPQIPHGYIRGVASRVDCNCLIDSLAQLVHPA